MMDAGEKRREKKKKKEKPGSEAAGLVVRLQSERSLLGVVKITYCL